MNNILWMLLAIPLVLASPVDAGAQVSCDNPDNLCTGNPCVIGTVTVVSPCEVDFGNITLEIAGDVTVPDGGTLSLTAREVQLLGRIDGRDVGAGADVTLVGGFSLKTEGKIDVTGGAGGGSVALTGGLLDVGAKILASSKLGPGGSVNLSGGQTILRQAIDVRGATGGSIATDTGFMQVNAPWNARGLAGSGGSVAVSAGGGGVDFAKTVDVRGHGGDGGTVTVSGHLGLDVPAKVLASGSVNGGSITFHGSILVWGKLYARGSAGNGGTLVVDPGVGGTVALPRNAKGDFRGGAGGGLVRIDADGIGFDRFQLKVGGKTGPGEVRLHHNGTTAAQLSGKVDARPSGIVEVLAPNADLTIAGTFVAGPAGCVGLSAGGTLDTTGLTTDVMLTPSCP